MIAYCFLIANHNYPLIFGNIKRKETPPFNKPFIQKNYLYRYRFMLFLGVFSNSSLTISIAARRQ